MSVEGSYATGKWFGGLQDAIGLFGMVQLQHSSGGVAINTPMV
jgi:hypothetical protein